MTRRPFSRPGRLRGRAPDSRFIVFGSQRTGSTLIATRLNSHPRIACFEEVLLPRVDSEPSLRSWLQAGGQSQTLRVFPPVKRSFLNSLVQSVSGVDAVGFKLMYEQVSLVPKLSYLAPTAGRLFHDRVLLQWLKENQVLVVHALRRNHLKVVVSHARAAKTRQFHSRDAVDGRAAKIVLPMRGLVPRLRRLEHAEAVARQMITGLRVVEVRYEDYVGRERSRIDRCLCAAMGVTMPPGGLTSPLAKVSGEDLSEVVANYDELASTLSGTRFEKFLA